MAAAEPAVSELDSYVETLSEEACNQYMRSRDRRASLAAIKVQDTTHLVNRARNEHS